MTYEQVLAEAKALSAEERRLLLEEIAASLVEKNGVSLPRGVPASRLRGIIKPEGPMPTDEELREYYVRYLIDSAHHAKLAVNAAKTVADFVFETYTYQLGRGTVTSRSEAPNVDTESIKQGR